MFACIPEVVPVICERSGEEIAVRTNGWILLEPPAKLVKKAFEPVEWSIVIIVSAVVMRPKRVKERAWQNQEVKVDVIFKSKHVHRAATADFDAFRQQSAGCFTILAESEDGAVAIRQVSGPAIAKFIMEVHCAEQRTHISEKHRVNIDIGAAVLV